MKLADLFTEKNIVWEMEADDKGAAIKELVKRLVASKTIPAKEAAAAEHAVLRREELGSTGIGKGVAVPHAKYAGLKGAVGVFGRSAKGIEFQALDGQPVFLVFMLLSGAEAIQTHVEALQGITRLVKDEDFCAFLKRGKSAKDLADLLREADERLR